MVAANITLSIFLNRGIVAVLSIF